MGYGLASRATARVARTCCVVHELAGRAILYTSRQCLMFHGDSDLDCFVVVLSGALL